MTRPRMCSAAADPTTLGGPRCDAVATYATPLGDRCDACVEHFRASARRPSSLMNVLTDGRARTEEEIARMIRRLDVEGN